VGEVRRSVPPLRVMSRITHSEPSLGVADGQVGVVVLVPDLSRAASQLGGAAIFAVVVAYAAVAHHGRDVGEGTLEDRRQTTRLALAWVVPSARQRIRFTGITLT